MLKKLKQFLSWLGDNRIAREYRYRKYRKQMKEQDPFIYK